ncbi:unnamed protein product, partial [Ectocarpus sp. 12 AP-2014]
LGRRKPGRILRMTPGTEKEAMLRKMKPGLRRSYFTAYRSFLMTARRTLGPRDRKETLRQAVEASVKDCEASGREGGPCEQPDRP